MILHSKITSAQIVLLTIVRYCQILSYLIVDEEQNFSKVFNQSILRVVHWAFKLTQLDLLMKNSSNSILVAILIASCLLMLGYAVSFFTTDIH